MTHNVQLARFQTASLLLLMLFSLATNVGQTYAQSDAEKESPLNAKYLIGDAVSLSNKEYPEIEKAIQRFRNGDVEGAQTYLDTALEKEPKLPPTEVMMAKMQLLARNARGVQFYLERAAINHPDDPEAFLIMADQAFAGQRTTESLALFEYAAPLVEKFTGNSKRKQKFSVRVLAGRAAVAERRGQWEKASDYLNQWIEVDPENYLAHTRMGIVLFRLDRAKDALAAFTKAREINPDAGHPFVALGQLFSANGETENARKSYDKAYNEDQTDTKVAQAYAEWSIQQGELDKAQEIATALLQQLPDSRDALLLDGIVAYMREQPDRAKQSLQKVLTLQPNNARALDMMALLLIQSNDSADKERALQYAQMNVNQLSNNAQAIVTKAYVLYELGRKEEAQKSLAEAGKLQILPDSTYLIAKILVAEKQNDKAIEALQKIVNQKTGLVIFRRDAQVLLDKLQAGS